MMAFQLLRPWALLLLPVAVLVLVLSLQSQDTLRGWRKQVERPLFELLRVGTGQHARLELLRLGLFALFGIVALSAPVWRLAPSPFAQDESVIVVVLDCSEKMVPPGQEPSLLLQAQLKLEDLLERRGGGKTALIAYAGTAHLVLPATEDSSVILEMAREVSPEIMPRPGRNVEAALLQAAQALGDRPGSVLLITDEVEDSAEVLAQTWKSLGAPDLQFYSMRSPVSASMRTAARSLQASLVTVTPDARDVEELQRGFSPSLRSVADDEAALWQEDGWWLLLPAALFFVLGFRRELSP